MKAAVITRYGSPDVIKILDAPKPAPAAGEVLIRVHATTVNRTDCGELRPRIIGRFLYGLRRPRRTIAGMDFAGVIEAVGAEVMSFKPGNRVFGMCPSRSNGAHAEYICIPETAPIAMMPANTRFDEAVGKASFFQCRKLLKLKGTFMATDVGPWGQYLPLTIWSSIAKNNRVLIPLPPRGSGPAFVEYLKARMDAGQFRAVIDRRYPLDAIADAYRYVETGQKVGIVVIDVA